MSRLEAPWPYDITRPNLLTRDLNADALMVHGVLNQEGRLESLAIAFPSSFRYASFVLRALRSMAVPAGAAERPADRRGSAADYSPRRRVAWFAGEIARFPSFREKRKTSESGGGVGYVFFLHSMFAIHQHSCGCLRFLPC